MSLPGGRETEYSPGVKLYGQLSRLCDTDLYAFNFDSVHRWSDSVLRWSDSVLRWNDSIHRWSDSVLRWNDSVLRWSDSVLRWSDSVLRWSDSVLVCRFSQTSTPGMKLKMSPLL